MKWAKSVWPPVGMGTRQGQDEPRSDPRPLIPHPRARAAAQHGIKFPISEIEYIDDDSPYYTMMDKVQTLEEPPWDKREVTYPYDIRGIKYHYQLLSTLATFQLYDRFTEVRRSLPGHEIYSGFHYPQCAFGLAHTTSLQQLRSLFLKFGGDMQYFYKRQSLLWLAQRFSWSIFPDDYKIDEFELAQNLFYSEDMVGWMALLLAIIKLVNQANDKIVKCREVYT